MKHSLKIDTLEFKIKLIISASLLFFLILSFFFAKNIELALGFRSNGSLGQVDYEAISGSNFYVEYLDVGQGNCSFVRLPDGKTILIDSGSDMYAETVEEFLKGRGVSTLDYVIATHADADHIGAFSYLFDKFEVKNVLRPFQIAGTGTNLENFEVYKDEDLAAAYNLIVEREGKSNSISRVTTVAYKNFITSIYSETYLEGNERKSCSVSVFYDGLVVSGNGYELEFFAPFVRDDAIDLSDYSKTGGFATKGYAADESNGSSAIFLLSVCGSTFLFTGDAPFSDSAGHGEGYEEVDFVNSLTSAERQKLSDVSVYLAGHHGSKYSSGEELLSLIKPKFVVISVGAINDYGHPSEEALERIVSYKKKGEQILRTSFSGTITFASVSGDLKFACTNPSATGGYSVSWILVSSVAFFMIEIIIISVRPLSRKNSKSLT